MSQVLKFHWENRKIQNYLLWAAVCQKRFPAKVTFTNAILYFHQWRFRTQYNIYDGAFLQKQFTAFSRVLFSQKSSILDILLGSKYASPCFLVLHFHRCRLSESNKQKQPCKGAVHALKTCSKFKGDHPCRSMVLINL